MSKNVIFQAKDWRDWYRVRDWLTRNAPEGYTLRSVQDCAPAAFEYPARYQLALMQFLYPEAYPVTPESPAGFTQPPPDPTPAPGRPDNPPLAKTPPVERVAAPTVLVAPVTEAPADVADAKAPSAETPPAAEEPTPVADAADGKRSKTTTTNTRTTGQPGRK